MGTAEIESALVAHPKVAEAAVVGYPHDIKGQGIYAYVTLNAGEAPTDDLIVELRNWVRQDIGPIASPDKMQWAPGLPKTRSGKIMRRILRKIAADDFAELGDTSTLADPSVVDELIANRQPNLPIWSVYPTSLPNQLQLEQLARLRRVLATAAGRLLLQYLVR